MNADQDRPGAADCDDEGPDYPEHPRLALVALMIMLSRFPRTGCPHMARSILEHLHYVAGDARYAPEFREAAARIHAEWCSDACERDGGETLH